MKPNRPHLVSSTKNSITIGWDPCDNLILKNKENITNTELYTQPDDDYCIKRWYILERKDRILGWIRVYMGFETKSEVRPLTPEDYYEFRLKVTTKTEESEYSDVFFAATKDDVIPAAYLHRAVENGPVTSLRKILSQRVQAIEIPNKQGLTPLRLAISKNNVNFMGILLNNGADMGNEEKGSGRIPLMIAAQKGYLEAVQLLLEKGSSWTTKDRNGLTALNYAIDNSHKDIVELAIKEGAELKTKDRFGWTPLMRGVLLKSSLEVIKYLLENGSDANEEDENGQTVLMQAVLSGRPEVVELLIQKGADITKKNTFGHSAYDMVKASSNEGMQEIAHLLGSEEIEEEINGKGKRTNLAKKWHKNRKEEY